MSYIGSEIPSFEVLLVQVTVTLDPIGNTSSSGRVLMVRVGAEETVRSLIKECIVLTIGVLENS